jgi:hypothetical protein
MRGKKQIRKEKYKKPRKKRIVSSTPSIRGHHPKSYAMNAYLIKGLSK